MSKITQLYKDDWLVYVIFSDGQVYIFLTEMWPEHLDSWECVFRAAKCRAIDLHDAGQEPFCIVSTPGEISRCQDEIDTACISMSDSKFTRLIRR